MRAGSPSQCVSITWKLRGPAPQDDAARSAGRHWPKLLLRLRLLRLLRLAMWRRACSIAGGVVRQEKGSRAWVKRLSESCRSSAGGSGSSTLCQAVGPHEA